MAKKIIGGSKKSEKSTKPPLKGGLDTASYPNPSKVKKSAEGGPGNLIDLAKQLADKFGINKDTVMEFILEYGPKIAEMVFSMMKKAPKSASMSCPAHFAVDLKDSIDLQTEALARSLCLKHCMETCEEETSDEDE